MHCSSDKHITKLRQSTGLKMIHVWNAWRITISSRVRSKKKCLTQPLSPSVEGLSGLELYLIYEQNNFLQRACSSEWLSELPPSCSRVISQERLRSNRPNALPVSHGVGWSVSAWMNKPFFLFKVNDRYYSDNVLLKRNLLPAGKYYS